MKPFTRGLPAVFGDPMNKEVGQFVLGVYVYKLDFVTVLAFLDLAVSKFFSVLI